LLEFAAWYVNNESCILQNGSSSGSTFQRGYGIFFLFLSPLSFPSFFSELSFEGSSKQASKQARRQAGRQASKGQSASQRASQPAR
jgi:hypothetical protein